MKLKLKLALNTFLVVMVAIESENKDIVATSISKERNMFVAPRDFYTMLLKNMENIQYQLMEVLGIDLKHVSF